MLMLPKGKSSYFRANDVTKFNPRRPPLAPSTSDDPVMRLVTPPRVSQRSRPLEGNVTS